MYAAYYFYQRSKHKRGDEPTCTRHFPLLGILLADVGCPDLHRELEQPTATKMGTPRITGTVRDQDVPQKEPAKPQGA